jgi:hypothetical protein
MAISHLRSAVSVATIGSVLAISTATVAAVASPAQVLSLVKASVAITAVPSNLNPTLTAAATDTTSIKVDAANYIKPTCNPYWTHSLAAHPAPCWYGDTKAKKTFVLFGDSNAGMWAAPLDVVLKKLHIRLALFGFFGCGTSFVLETATTQPGFPTEWQLCNTWHANLPGAVRKLHPFAIADASSPYRYGTGSYYAGWVAGMTKAFSSMTKGAPKTLRLEIGTVPLFSASPPTCLASYPTAVQNCAVKYSDPSSTYPGILTRDAAIAKAAHTKYFSTNPWLCYKQQCSPVIGSYLSYVDQDHLSTPYALYLSGAVQQSLIKLRILP